MKRKFTNSEYGTLHLRPFDHQGEEDFLLLKKQLSNAKIAKGLSMSNGQPIHDKNTLERVWNKFSGFVATHNIGMLKIYTEEEEFVGCAGGIICDFHKDDETKVRTVEPGYILNEKFWGKGIGTDVARHCMSYYCHGRKDIEKLCCTAFHHNLASSKIILRMGFEFMGMGRKKNGAVVNYFEVRREEWKLPDLSKEETKKRIEETIERIKNMDLEKDISLLPEKLL